MSGMRRIGMILSSPDKNLVVVDEKVETIMRGFVVGHEGRAEAGGIFLGCYRGPHIEITDCTIPQPEDVRSLFLFDRRDAAHRRRALEAWKHSGNVLTCVGEWHTHPEDHPSPSCIDRANWRKIIKRQGDDPLVFMIVGRKGVWCALARARTIARLQVVEMMPTEHFSNLL
jgi:integrative and conjugative element protein (TIGR02256 family)